MDIFLEQLVTRKSTTSDLLKKIAIILVGIICIYLSIFVLPNIIKIFSAINFLLSAGIVYYMWFLITSFDVEYEYIFTNGEIDIDKIVSKRKRTRLITMNCRDFLEFGKYDPEVHNLKQYDSKILACTSPDALDTYYSVVQHKKYGRCLVVFNPNELIIKNSKQFIKRNVIKD